MPFEKITVKNIVDDCGLTRNTFYNYFEDTYDVVEGLLRAQMCDLVRQAEGAWARTSSDGAVAGLSQAMHQASRFALEHPKAVKHLFRSSKREELGRYFAKALEIIVGHLVDDAVGERHITPDDRTLIVNACCFVASGFFQQWVAGGMQTSLEDTLSRLDEIFDHSIYQAVQRATEQAGGVPVEPKKTE